MSAISSASPAPPPQWRYLLPLVGLTFSAAQLAISLFRSHKSSSLLAGFAILLCIKDWQALKDNENLFAQLRNQPPQSPSLKPDKRGQEASKALQTTTEELKRLEEELASGAKAIAQNRKNLGLQEARSQELLKEILSRENTLRALQQEINNHSPKEKNTKSNREETQKQEQLAELETKLQNLMDEIREKEAENEEQERRLLKLEELVQLFTGDITNAIAQLPTKLKGALEILTQELIKKEERLNLIDNLEKTTQRLKAAQASVSQESHRLQKISKEIQQQNSLLEKIKLENELQEKRSVDLTTLRRESLKGLISQSKGLQISNTLKGELKYAEDRLNSLNEKEQVEKREREQVLSDLEEKGNRLDTHIRKKEKSLEELRKKIRKEDKALSDLSKRWGEITSQINRDASQLLIKDPSCAPLLQALIDQLKCLHLIQAVDEAEKKLQETNATLRTSLSLLDVIKKRAKRSSPNTPSLRRVRSEVAPPSMSPSLLTRRTSSSTGQMENLKPTEMKGQELLRVQGGSSGGESAESPAGSTQ